VLGSSLLSEINCSLDRSCEGPPFKCGAWRDGIASDGVGLLLLLLLLNVASVIWSLLLSGCSLWMADVAVAVVKLVEEESVSVVG